jgi:glutamyl-tRNA reductase
MPILLYGMNHVSAPLDVRERVAFPPAELVAAVGRLVRSEPVAEGLILSTCNRTELLVHARADRAGQALRLFLAEERQVSEDLLERHCYLRRDEGAVHHVFRVACSLDSMIVGEAQILGQVKEAYAAAQKAGTLGTVLESLMQRSLSVAKKVRTETGIARYPVSIAHAAAGLARRIFGDLRDNAILILGAGKMARLAVQHLMGHGVASVVVVNRSYQRAADLAQELGGRAAPFDRLFEEMQQADIVIASTAAPRLLVGHEDVQRISRSRRGRPLFFIDIAVPRDIDPRVNEINNVYIYDIDDLQGVVRRNLEERRHEAVQAESIVTRETEHYLAWLRTQEVGPLIVELRHHLHEIGQRERERFGAKLGALDAGQKKALEDMTNSLINKILHHPIQAMKRAAAQDGGGGRLDFVRRVFGLLEVDPDPRPERSTAPSAREDAAGSTPAEAADANLESDRWRRPTDPPDGKTTR